MRLRERWPPPQATRNRACLEPRRALPRRVYCCVPENPLRTNRRTKGKARTKPKIQVQITPSILNGFDQDFSHRSVNTRSRRSKKKIAKRLGRRCLHHHVLLLFRAPCGPPMTPSGLLGSLDPGLLASTLHRLGPSARTFRSTEPTRVHPSTRSFSVNLSPDLHLAPPTIMPHPTPAHHKPRDTSNPHDVVNHSSSKGDHHWSSLGKR